MITLHGPKCSEASLALSVKDDCILPVSQSQVRPPSTQVSRRLGPNVPKLVLSRAATLRFPQTPERPTAALGPWARLSTEQPPFPFLQAAACRLLARQLPLLRTSPPTHRQRVGEPREEGWKEIYRAQNRDSPSCFHRRGQRDRKRKYACHFLWLSFRPVNYFRWARCSTIRPPVRLCSPGERARESNWAATPGGGVAGACGSTLPGCGSASVENVLAAVPLRCGVCRARCGFPSWGSRGVGHPVRGGAPGGLCSERLGLGSRSGKASLPRFVSVWPLACLYGELVECGVTKWPAEGRSLASGRPVFTP